MRKTLTLMAVVALLVGLAACSSPPPPDKVFTSENNVFTLTIPDTVTATTVTSPNADTVGVRIKSSDGMWSIEAFDNAPPMSPVFLETKAQIEQSYGATTPITIAGKEGYYFVEVTANTVQFSICFPNLTSEQPDAPWGAVWLKVLGHQKDLYSLDIPELQQILDSIRVPKK